MTKRMRWDALLGLLLWMAFCGFLYTMAQGDSPSNPAPVGVEVDSEIHCGESAVSLEPYDAEITLQQIVRGKEAWERIRAENQSAEAPKPGFDYLLAKVRFELKARVAPGNKSFQLGRPFQLTAFSADGEEYEAPTIRAPAPELSGHARAGSPMEGWVLFLVDQKDLRPLMAFDPSSGAAMLRGKVLWFQLY